MELCRLESLKKGPEVLGSCFAPAPLELALLACWPTSKEPEARVN